MTDYKNPIEQLEKMAMYHRSRAESARTAVEKSLREAADAEREAEASEQAARLLSNQP